jgi:hypothetical protein
LDFVESNSEKYLSKIKDNETVIKPTNLVFCRLCIIDNPINNHFSSKLGNLTVVLRVAGAGIAFALQEVIASLLVGRNYVW